MASSQAPSNGAPLELQGASIIGIKGLQCPHPVFTTYVWGSSKEQPAYLDIKIRLSQQFGSAAAADVLDDSTMHYGQLAKDIQAACVPGADALELLSKVEEVILAAGARAGGNSIIEDTTVDLILPKASMYGEEFRLSQTRRLVGGTCSPVERSCLCEFRGLKLSGLIGVNQYERTGSQPIHASLMISDALMIDRVPEDQKVLLNAVHGCENVLNDAVQQTQQSRFETLEALIQHAIRAIHDHLYKYGVPRPVVHLRLGKPKAIPFADTAWVELQTGSSI